jgi:hypothetical protein
MSFLVYVAFAIGFGLVPHRIAKKRAHPKTGAILVSGLLTALLFPVLWFGVLAWAYLPGAGRILSAKPDEPVIGDALRELARRVPGPPPGQATDSNGEPSPAHMLQRMAVLFDGRGAGADGAGSIADALFPCAGCARMLPPQADRCPSCGEVVLDADRRRAEGGDLSG